MKQEKIIFTGNTLRFTPPFNTHTNQIININWLSNLLSPIFLSCLDIPTKTIVWDFNTKFDSRKIYEMYGLKLTERSYAELLNKAPNENLLQYMSDFFSGHIVVGFEIPNIFIECFSRLNINYIDIVLAPWRFLPDMTFGLRTNQQYWFKQIWNNRLDDYSLYCHAGLLSAQISRSQKKHYQDNSALFAGQVPNDVSLLKNGKFISLEQFDDKISELAKKYKQLYYKPHPCVSSGVIRKQRNYLKKFGKIVEVNDNIYFLLAHEQIRGYYALTSSITKEAKYFGRHGESLSDYPFKYIEDGSFDHTSYIPVYTKILQPTFWANIFEVAYNGHYIDYPPNCIRQSLGMSWGLDLSRSTKKVNSTNSRYKLSMLKRFIMARLNT